MSENSSGEPPVGTTITVTLTAVIYPEPEAGGYSAEVPALSGCYTQGESLEEVRDSLREAAEGWLAAAHDAAIRALDAEDLAAFHDRAEEPTLSLEELVRHLKGLGKLSESLSTAPTAPLPPGSTASQSRRS